MRKKPDRERRSVPPVLLGDLCDAGVAIVAECKACGARWRIDPATIVAAPSLPVGHIGPVLVCECGGGPVSTSHELHPWVRWLKQSGQTSRLPLYAAFMRGEGSRRPAEPATVAEAREDPDVCTLYSHNISQAQLARELNAYWDRVWDDLGNLGAQKAIFPDYEAPVARHAPDGNGVQLTRMRWGIPGPEKFGAVPITNVRNVASSHWRPWLKPEFRCLVPASSFCEYQDTKPRKTPIWFALDETRPLFWFAGIWRPWAGTRGTKSAPITGEHRLYSFLTTDPNAVVAPIHPKAMPVILRTGPELRQWMTGTVDEALALQKPAADDVLRIVARGLKEDGTLSSPGSSGSELPSLF